MGRPTILISEGHPGEAWDLARLAEREGLKVVTDTTGRVVELARHYQPSLIILNVQQRAGDGLELLAGLRENAATLQIRVVATANHADEFARTVCYEMGALAFVVKPYDASFVQVLSRLAQGASRGSARSPHSVVRLGHFEAEPVSALALSPPAALED